MMRFFSFLLLLVSLSGSLTAMADAPVAEQRSVLHRRIAVSPGELALRVRIIELELNYGTPEAALQEIRLAEVFLPDAPRIRRMEARVYLQREDPAQALVVLDRLLVASAPSAEAYILRAQAREALGDDAGAIEDLGAALQLSERIDVYLDRGRLLEHMNRVAEAEQNYQDGVLATGATTLRRALIRQQRANGHFREALREVDFLVSQSGRASRFLVLRAELLRSLGRGDEAHATLAEAFDRAVNRMALRPSSLALLERGRVLLAQGRVREARADFEDVLLRAPRMAEVHALLAQARRVTQ